MASPRPSGHVHVHVDCSQGISCRCMIDTCLEEGEKYEDVYTKVKTLLQLDEMFDRCNEPPKHLDELSQQLKGSWLKDNLLATLKLLEKGGLVASQIPGSECSTFRRQVELLAVTLYVLERKSIQSTSYSCLSWGSIRNLPSWLLEGLICSTDATDCYVAAESIALLQVLSAGQNDEMPNMRIQSAVTGDALEPRPHSVRLVIGTLVAPPSASPSTLAEVVRPAGDWSVQQMVVLEANIDDQTAEHLAVCVELLLQAGAADAWLSPIVMKKSRSANTLHCLCRRNEVKNYLRIMFKHSTTLGVRIHEVDRVALRREVIRVRVRDSDTPISVKIGFLDDKAVSFKAELDHCLAVTRSTGQPVSNVAEQAVLEARAIAKTNGWNVDY